jgi:hypothetical protein
MTATTGLATAGRGAGNLNFKFIISGTAAAGYALVASETSAGIDSQSCNTHLHLPDYFVC